MKKRERNAYPWDKTILSLLKSDEIWNDLPFVDRVLDQFNKILDTFQSDAPTLVDVSFVIKSIRTGTFIFFAWKEGPLETEEQYTIISHRKIDVNSLQVSLNGRLKMMHSDEVFLADLLDPKHIGQSFSSNKYTLAKDFLEKILNGNEAFYDKITNHSNCFQSRSEQFSVPEIWRHIDNPSLDVEDSAADWWSFLPRFISVKHCELRQVMKVCLFHCLI